MPIIMYVHMHFRRAYFKARGVKKASVPDMIKTELTMFLLRVGLFILMYIASFMAWLGPGSPSL